MTLCILPLSTQYFDIRDSMRVSWTHLKHWWEHIKIQITAVSSIKMIGDHKYRKKYRAKPCEGISFCKAKLVYVIGTRILLHVSLLPEIRFFCKLSLLDLWSHLMFNEAFSLNCQTRLDALQRTRQCNFNVNTLQYEKIQESFAVSWNALSTNC